LSIKCLTFLRPMGLCYYALGWRKVPRLETTTVTYYHSENMMNKGFDNIGDRLKEDSCFYLWEWLSIHLPIEKGKYEYKQI